MKVLVTGGAGFIGTNLVNKLIRDGHEVVVIDDMFLGRLDNLSDLPKRKLVVGDEKAFQSLVLHKERA